MANLIVMVGISGSGKSSVAQGLAKKYNAIILSSDKLREEMYNNVNDIDHNSEVFNELNKRLKFGLRDGKNVIVDATNLTIKSRKNILNTAKYVERSEKVKINKIAYILTKPVEICIQDDQERTKKVGKFVIMKQARSFQMPFYEEGFDEIIIHKFMNRKVTSQETFEDLIYGMQGFDQKSKHHKYDLFEHTMLCYNELNNRIGAEKPDLIVASLLHDIGKMDTQVIYEEDNEAHYFGHENLGTYQLLDILRIVGDISNTVNTLFYINYHMLPFSWRNKDAFEKYEQLFGKEKYQNLMLLHECDKIACGV